MKKNLTLNFTVLVFILAIPISVLAKSPGFTTIELPDPWHADIAIAINNRGQIVGSASGPGGKCFFLFDRHTFTTIDFPESPGISIQDINDRGQVVGHYFDNELLLHAFLFDRGTLTMIDLPEPWHADTAFGINNRGQIVGTCSGNNEAHSYLLDGDNFTTFDFPEARYTHAYGINDRGQIVGQYTDINWASRVFLLDRDTFTTIDFPETWDTYPRSINNRGQIVGSYWDSGGPHGFLFDGNIFTMIDFPGAEGTGALGINDRGQIAGYYLDSNWNSHGFLVEKIRMAPPASAPYLKVTTTWARIRS